MSIRSMEAEITPETDHLYRKLSEVGLNLRRDQVLSDFELAAAFLGVGVRMARNSHGPGVTAEWMRDIADQLEQSIWSMQ